MKKALIILTVLGAGLAGIDAVPAKGELLSSWLAVDHNTGVAPVSDATYIEECGSCHFAYQPGLLPEASWLRLMDAKALEDHFGDNAELDEKTRSQLLKLLIAASADKSSYPRSKKVMASVADNKIPGRIIEVPYISRKHHGIPDKMLKDNPKVKSLSQCDKCHTKADKGIYDDATVVIPDYGNWTW